MQLSSFFSPLILRVGSTRATVIGAKKRILFDEPARVALSLSTGKIVAFGKKAVELSFLGAPDIKVTPLFQNGILLDTELCTQYLLWMRDSFTTTRLRRVIPYPVVVCTPVGFAQPYAQLFDGALRAAHFFPFGMKQAVLGDVWMEKKESSSDGAVICIRMGATQTQVAVVSGDQVLAATTLAFAGDEIDIILKRFIRRKYSMSVPLSLIPAIKEEYTKAQYSKSSFSYVVRGKHTKRSDVTSVTIHADDIVEVITHFFDLLAHRIQVSLLGEMQSLFVHTKNPTILLSGGLSLFEEAQTSLETVLQVKVTQVSRPTVASTLGIAGMLA